MIEDDLEVSLATILLNDVSAIIERLRSEKSKKHKGYHVVLDKYYELLCDPKNSLPLKFDWNKTYLLMRLGFQSKSFKTIENTANFFHKLSIQGEFDLRCYDYTPHVAMDENFMIPRPEYPNSYEKSDVLLIHIFVVEIFACIIRCMKEGDSLLFSLFKLLMVSINKIRGDLTAKTTLIVVKEFLNILTKSKNTIIQTHIKNLLHQIIEGFFEQVNCNLEIQYYQSQNNIPLLISINSTNYEEKVISAFDQEEARVSMREEIYIKLNKKIKTHKVTPIDLYCYAYLNSIFDGVCFNVGLMLQQDQLEKSNSAEKIANNEGEKIESSEVSTNNEEVQKVEPFSGQTESARNNYVAKKIISSNATSLTSDFFKIKGLKNELDIENGLFGWCFMCREPANYYCKDTRVPICGAECKLKHLIEIERCAKFQAIMHLSHQISDQQIKDVCTIIKKFEKYLNYDNKKLSWRKDPKIQIYLLEVLIEIFENPGHYIRKRIEFILEMKTTFFPSLIRLCFSAEREVCRLSLSIFIVLIKWFRTYLKNEFRVFVEEIFYKILDSGNSLYTHKILALRALQNLVQKPALALEIFLNYDCDVHQKNIFENILSILSKIAQGKYTRADYASSMTESQELDMKSIALDSILNLIHNLYVIMFKSEKSLNQKTHLNQRKTKGKNFEDLVAESSCSKNVEGSLQKKNQISRAISMFNSKLKHGMKELLRLNVFSENAQDVANFLYTTKGLSKNKIGELFGSEEKFNNEILKEFTNLMNFKDIQIDDAMRHFLQLFELPGEGQQVERIVMAFASKYALDNSNQITADASSYLSFLLMMLQTDAHNPQVKEKMKLQEFLKLGKSIKNGDQPLPEAYLTNLYYKILKTPLALPERELHRKQIQESVKMSKSNKKTLYVKESTNIIKITKEILSRRSSEEKDNSWINADMNDYLLSFMESSWTTFLVVFSLCFEMNDDPDIVRKCLKGLCYMIKILSELNMETEKETFINSLEKFAGVHSLSNIKMKNILCLKKTLKFLKKNGKYIGSSWRVFIPLVSRIDFFLALSQKLAKNDLQILAAPISKVLGNKNLDEQKAELIKSAIIPSELDEIFVRSEDLDEPSILHFVSALCETSKKEIEKELGTRTFALKRIALVAEFNLKRKKIEWTRIWNILKVHFEEVSLMPNIDLNIFTIDLLKQIVSKFLEKDTGFGFDYNDELFNLFLQIYQKNKIKEVHHFIMSCLINLLQFHRLKIRSGLFPILDLCIYTNEENPTESLKLLKEIVSTPTITEIHIEAILSFIGKSLLLQKNIFIQPCIEFIKTISNQLEYALQLSKFITFILDDRIENLVGFLNSLFANNIILITSNNLQNEIYKQVGEDYIISFINYLHELVLGHEVDLSIEEQDLFCMVSENLGKLVGSVPEWSPGAYSALMKDTLNYMSSKGNFCQKVGLVILKELLNEKSNLEKETVMKIYQIIQSSNLRADVTSYFTYENILDDLRCEKDNIGTGEILNAIIVLKKLGQTKSAHLDLDFTKAFIFSSLKGIRSKWFEELLKGRDPGEVYYHLEIKILRLLCFYLKDDTKQFLVFVTKIIKDLEFVIYGRRKEEKTREIYSILSMLNLNLLKIIVKILRILISRQSQVEKDCLLQIIQLQKLFVQNALYEKEKSDLATIIIEASNLYEKVLKELVLS